MANNNINNSLSQISELKSENKSLAEDFEKMKSLYEQELKKNLEINSK